MLFATVIAELQALTKSARIPFERLATITIRNSKLCHELARDDTSGNVKTVTNERTESTLTCLD